MHSVSAASTDWQQNMGGSESAFHTLSSKGDSQEENFEIDQQANPQLSRLSKHILQPASVGLTYYEPVQNWTCHDSISIKSSKNVCQICGDRSTGNHYGANSCDGCKGFFRRTVRNRHSYVCRFQNRCAIDKDKRNTCRSCRYNKCLVAGMRKDGVQNERDRIKKCKTEISKVQKMPIEPMPNAELMMVIEAETVARQMGADYAANATHGYSGSASANRLASMHDFTEAIKLQLLLLVEWSKALPPFCDLDLSDQVALLRAYAPAHLLLGVARRSTPYRDVLLLSNDAWIPRKQSSESELHDVNNVAFKVLDELVEPLRDLVLNDQEIGCLKALLLFNPNAQGLSSKERIKALRLKILETLQDYEEGNVHSTDPVRFGNILLLPPPLHALSQQFVENLQLASLFYNVRFDKLLEELLLSTSEPFTAPFLSEGIAAVADHISGGMLNIVNGPFQPEGHFEN